MQNTYKHFKHGPYDYIKVSSSSNLVIPLDVAKDHLFLPAASSVDDAVLTLMIKGLAEYVEKLTYRTILTSRYKCFMDYLPREPILIKKSPLQELVSFEYYSNNTLTALSLGDVYTTESSTYSMVDTISGKDWPQHDYRKQAIKLTFDAGYGDTHESVPADLKMAMMHHLAKWFEQRGDIDDQTARNEGLRYSIQTCMPHTSKAIYAQYKIMQTKKRDRYVSVQAGVPLTW